MFVCVCVCVCVSVMERGRCVCAMIAHSLNLLICVIAEGREGEEQGEGCG